MNRLRRRARRARALGVYVIQWPGKKTFDVFAESEAAGGPRGLDLTRRAATHLAYAIALSAKPRLIVSTAP